MRVRVRGGEREAFGELYEAHASAVYNHALRLTGDWSVAEEVMSETFLAAWRGRGDVLEGGGSLRPWLLGIATNKALNAQRSLRRRLAFLASRRGEPEAVDDFADEAVSRIDDARRLAEVQRVLKRLRRHEREVIALCVWAGLDYAQAAEALGVPVGTVRSRLSRARARLREFVEREAGDGGRAPGAAGRTTTHAARTARTARTARRERTAPGAHTGSGTRTGFMEPRSRRGEVESEAAFVALPLQEEAR
ncbi:RNA polymerase sigma factor [Streptomyces aurantiogriseus]|uniref:RNA polymerase sigma factor n=1 Tax=Streptomyces aurantiogriseus TaxID=66870 RepID=UPI001678F6AF|nr:RNA polymerase sigma factor [Streptomyces aurantiogriseus]